MFKYAGIVINNESSEVDKIFTYEIPENLINFIKIGQRVKVPFGRGNKIVFGFIIELYETYESTYNIKKINSICDDFTVLREKDIKFINLMRKKYICTYLDCIKLIIPTGINRGMKQKISSKISIKNKLTGKYEKEPYNNIFFIVKNNNGKYTKNELSKNFKLSLSSINTLIKYEFLSADKKIVDRYNEKKYEKYDEKILNENQQFAVNTIINSNKNKFLIHGVTGSGKTEIYMNLVSIMMKQGKDSIILVPEIALTPQTVERFKGRFGNKIAVFHSRLSDGERYDEWIRVKSSKVKIAVGARSAIFLPFSNLGMIVIDEEHETSYKSEITPKYTAVEVGIMKSELENCKLILGSATPSLETYYKCIHKEMEIITISERADGAKLPKISVVDMKEELALNNKSMFSRLLLNEIHNTLSKGEQIILFLNRRGHSTFVSCRKCGYVFKCEHCDISLTYHNESNKLICHYCGNTKNLTSICPKCGSKYVKYFGAGTEKIEKEINKIFPKAKTLRMDYDTTRHKNAYEIIYNKFKAGKADILIGTQMVAKGLDFKNVTLVGVVAADLSLNLPDYRASERTFQLINQVSGRAGRGSKEGKVIIQTYSAESHAIRAAANNDYLGFYEEEIKIRKSMEYPPFSDIFLINISSKNENLLIKNTQNISLLLKNIIKEYSNIKMLGPCPCVISKIKEMFRWQIILRGKINYELAAYIKKFLYECIKNDYNDIRISIDINPISLL